MIAPAATLFAALLLCAGPARAFSSAAPYDARTSPLDELSRELLTVNGYEIRADGVVWDKIGEGAVARTDMPYLLSRLASAKRLRALLEINNIITRYDSERKLTPEDKEAVRALVRQNWVVFGIAPRNDFRSYFAPEEREALDKIPPRFESMIAMTMTDPPIESVTGDEPADSPAAAAPPSVTALPPSAAPSVTAPPPAAAAAPAAPAAPVRVASARTIPTLAPLMEPPSLRRESPFAAPAAPPAAPAPAPVAPAVVAPIAVAPSVPAAPVVAAVVPAAPVVAAVAPSAPIAAPAVAAVAAAGAPPIVFGTHSAAPAATYKFEAAPVPVAPVVYTPPPVPPPTAVVAADLGTLKAWTPPAAAAPAAIAAPRPAAAPAPAAPPVAAVAPPPEAPKARAVSESEYSQFIAAGPYNAGGKAVLELIGKRAPEYCLPLLRRTVVVGVPQIVSDGARTGAELRAGYSFNAARLVEPPVVALSPGPVFVEVKAGLFGGREAVLLPESPKAWTDLGVTRPPLDALRENATPLSTETSDWGATRVYADGSRRGSYSATEMAGELLEQLLLLGLSREGLDASPYAARRWARTARLMFYARLKEETQQDNFLDPDRRAELRVWLDHPDEADDLSAAVWSGSREQLLDPRRGPPAAAVAFEASARATCVRSALEDGLAESARRRAARAGELATLTEAGVLDSSAAKSAAQAAADADASARARLLAAPPACAAENPAREEGLRKASLLLAESARAERMMRERKAGIETHAL